MDQPPTAPPTALEPPARGLGWTDSALIVAEHVLPLVSGGASEGHWLLDLFSSRPISRQGAWLSLHCGGIIGIVVGVGLVELLAFVQSKANSDALEFLGAPTFSLGVAFTTVALLGSIGFLAGFFPSRRAVTIQPAAALRYE